MKLKILQITIDIVVFLGVMMFSMTVSGSADSQCSCYKFDHNLSDWEKSRNTCNATGGDIVSIETLQEWEFISKEIKTITDDTSNSQWWIGLQRKNGLWVWFSNNNVTYDRWKTMSLNEREKDIYIFAVIDKVDGKFIKAEKSLSSGKICEYKGKACNVNQTKWCSKASPSTTSSFTTTTTKPFATEEMNTTTISLMPTKNPTYASHNDSVFQPLPTGDKDERSVKPAKKQFPYNVLVVVLVIILLVCVCVLIAVWINKSRKRGEHSISQRRKGSVNNLDVALDVQYMYDQYPEELSDQGNAVAHDNLVDNNSVPEKLETIKTNIEEAAEIHEQNPYAVCETKNVYIKESDFPNKTHEEDKEEGKAQNEEQELTDKPDTQVLTTFITKVEEEDDVFYGEEIVEQQDNLTTVDEKSSEIFTYATISETETKKPDDGLYAEVNDNNEENEEHDVTYAEIAEFSANSTEPVKKPTPYYPTEYASVTVHPLSPRFSDD